MNRQANLLLALAIGAALLAGCGILKKKQTEPAPSASQVVLEPPPAATPLAPAPTPEPTLAVTDDAIAAPEDFEDEAFQKISDKTYKAELDRLKKEFEGK